MTAPAAFSPLLAPARSLLAGLRRLHGMVARRLALGQLDRLDDRLLRDIGLTRHDLWAAHAEPLFRDPTLALADRAREARLTARAPARDAAGERPLATLQRRWAEERHAA